MTQRVLATDSARQAAQRMRALLERGLPQQLQQVVVLGTTLAKPRVWEGREAAAFRGGWPRARQSMASAMTGLSSLSTHADQVLADVTKAGSDGALGTGGPPSWRPGAQALANLLVAAPLPAASPSTMSIPERPLPLQPH